MINLAGLSAAYPGYMAQEDQTAKTQANQSKARDAAIKLLGANVAGAALAAGNGPQAPPPGQASVPMHMPGANGVVGNLTPAPPPVAAPSPPPAAAPAPPPASPPPAGAQAPEAAVGGKLGLPQAVQAILKSTPGVANHPEVLLSALTHLDSLGLLDPEAGSKIAETNKLPTLQRIGAVRQALSPPNPNVPPVKLLKPETVTTFANGQKWTLGPDGQPKQVQ